MFLITSIKLSGNSTFGNIDFYFKDQYVIWFYFSKGYWSNSAFKFSLKDFRGWLYSKLKSSWLKSPLWVLSVIALQNLGIAKFIDMFDLSLVLKIYLPHIKLWKCPRFWKLDIYHNQPLGLLFGYNLRKFLSNYSF